ncbi:hypothetical protein COX25_03400 [bacterium (Candidatus Howlettbacteria) CG23_combo_of_CG06-09_8_20_14_all_37_9]|nr:MAG: hypothetical protein COX25_03400 [bacterium (Candidatus Howlettbacteria) CG23_combo_of_CG06-09_8_20_14_all_37_9]
MKTFHDLYPSIISLENLFESWQEFKYRKRKKPDVKLFERYLEDNLFSLHKELKNKTYRHDDYTSFYITDPKLRHIHKAVVRDRVVHNAVYRILYPIFDASFIYDSYSCRIGKGTHIAVRRLENFARKVGRNYTGPCFVLKCDVRKYFDSVDHKVLKEIINRRVKDENVLWLINGIIDSFKVKGKTNSFCHSESPIRPRTGFDSESILAGSQIKSGMTKKQEEKGMPIGNLTSQLFANIYLNELDQFVKHDLQIKYYLRYCDDFVILSDNIGYLKSICAEIDYFLKENLKLSLHPQKVTIRKFREGIDFLGYVVLPA